MAFCNRFMGGIRKIVNQIGPKLTDIVKKITQITGTIKEVSDSPAVDLLIKLIPHGTEIQKAFIKGLEILTGVTSTTESIYEDLKNWIDSQPTEFARNKALFNLAQAASLAADTADGSKPKNAKIYEGAVYARIIADTPPENLEPTGLA